MDNSTYSTVVMYYMDPTNVMGAVYGGWTGWRGGVVDDKHHAGGVKVMMVMYGLWIVEDVYVYACESGCV